MRAAIDREARASSTVTACIPARPGRCAGCRGLWSEADGRAFVADREMGGETSTSFGHCRPTITDPKLQPAQGCQQPYQKVRWLHRASRFTAGAFGFVSFSQSREPLAHNALEAEFAGVAENNIHRQIVAMLVEMNARPRLHPPQYPGQRGLAHL